MAQHNRGRVSDPAQAALSGSQNEAPGSAGGNLTLPACKHFTYQQTLPLQLRTVVNEVAGPGEGEIRIGDAAAPAQVFGITDLIAILEVGGAGHVSRLLPGKAGLRLETVRHMPLDGGLQ